MPRILLEDCHGHLITDTTKIVTESVGPFTFTKIPCRLSVIGEKNGNGRRYGKSVWEKNLAEGSALRQSLAENSTFGLLEHPKDGEVGLNSPLAVLLIEARIEGNEILGSFRILNTEEGKKLQALIEAGYNPMVSSRGYGSLAPGADGVDEVQDDYICEGWDVVLKPSFRSARMMIPAFAPSSTTESTTASPYVAIIETSRGEVRSKGYATEGDAREWLVSMLENFEGQKVKSRILRPDGTLSESLSAAAPVAESTKPKTKDTTMDIKEIKNQIEVMRREVPSKLTPQRFAEGMSRFTELHNAAAKTLSEDVSRSWEVTQLHESIREIETAWQNALAAPTKEVTRLTENYNKSLKLTKAVIETAVTHRKTATKALAEHAKTKAMLAETLKKGRAWVERCKRAEASQDITKNESYQVVCEAARKLAAMVRSLKEEYRTDVLELGRTVLEQQFADKLKADPALAQRLAEAQSPEDIVSIREAITGIKEKKDDKKKSRNFAALKKEKEVNDKHEDKKGEKGEPTLAKKDKEMKESIKPASGTSLKAIVEIVKHTRRPEDFEESIAIVNRLSEKNKQLVG